MENDPMNQPVTRSEFQTEIKKLATKEDLKKFATKKDLEKFATKKDMQKLAENTNKEIRRLDGKIDWVAAKVMENREYIDEKFNLVLNKLDGLAGVFDVIRTEQVATDAAITRIDNNNEVQDKKLTDHEYRISTLERQAI
jgi:hypothetical protein